MVPVLRVLVYYPVRETRMAKAVSSGETSVSRPKNVTWKLYYTYGRVLRTSGVKNFGLPLGPAG